MVGPKLTRLCVLVAALLTGSAHAQPLSTRAPELDGVASAISGEDIQVRCWTDEQDLDAIPGTWGWVYLNAPVVYLEPRPCAGALAIVDGGMLPLWQLGLGALTLTHESYHLKFSLPYWRRASEAQTECRAVKRVRQTMVDLGASQELADAVLPWSLAEHYRYTSISEEFVWSHCRVPVFADFWP
jgi:hypothetical protein